MKRIVLRLIAVVLSLAVVCSVLLVGAAQEGAFDKTIEYAFNGVKYLCAVSAEVNSEPREDEEEGDRYMINYVFDSVAEPIKARLSEGGFSLDNSQPGMDHVFRQEIWNVFAEYFMELYCNAFGKEMIGRSVDGAARELQMHYWMFRFGAVLKQMTAPVDLIVGKVPQLARLFKLLNTVYHRAMVTELGPTDGSDLNGYIFEQGNSDLQCLFLYGRDFLSLDFMGKLVEQTDQMSPDALERIDHLIFYPNDLEKFAEAQSLKYRNFKIESVLC